MEQAMPLIGLHLGAACHKLLSLSQHLCPLMPRPFHARALSICVTREGLLAFKTPLGRCRSLTSHKKVGAGGLSAAGRIEGEVQFMLGFSSLGS
jgi:hypothetical protein